MLFRCTQYDFEPFVPAFFCFCFCFWQDDKIEREKC
jgi:hypothetical protein